MRIDKELEKMVLEYKNLESKTFINENGYESYISIDSYLNKCEMLKNNLFIYGAPGVGKTHFGFNLQANKSNTKLYKWYEIVEKRLNGESDDDKSIKKFILPNCLIIDDFLSRKISEFNINLFFEIIDTRLDLKKQTIITTNYSPDEFKNMLTSQSWLDKYLMQRIFSRMKNFTVIKFDGEDLRGIKNNDNKRK